MTGLYNKTVKYENDKLNIFLSDLKENNSALSIFNKDLNYFKYDINKFQFNENILIMLAEKKIINNSIDVKLEKLHEYVPLIFQELDESQLNQVSKLFFDTSLEFEFIYKRFIKEVIKPLIGSEIFYQKIPTLRFHFPNQKHSFNWKNPTIHNDLMLGHPPHEMNIWTPFTKTYGTNTMVIMPLAESMELLQSIDYQFDKFSYDIQNSDTYFQKIFKKMIPVEIDYGDFLIFDSRCLHATLFNDTVSTRISMDARIILSDSLNSLKIPYVGTGRLKMPFSAGHYYSNLAV